MNKKDHRYRIDYEIIVDCYDEYEQRMGWIVYLTDNMEFPFKAEYTGKSQPFLKTGDAVKVLGLSVLEDEDDFEDDDENYEEENFQPMLEVEINGNSYDIPLEEIKNIDANKKTKQAIEDWGFWVKNY